MIYLNTLSDAFNAMATIFSSMTQAVGAADKVFELIRRQPKCKTATSVSALGHALAAPVGFEAGSANGKRGAEVGGVVRACRGEVELRNVDFEYPSR